MAKIVTSLTPSSLLTSPYRVVTDLNGRGDEARPTDDGTFLGRVLSVLGAPVGPKAEQHLSLPEYLKAAPNEIQAQYVYSYLENRAIEHQGKTTLTVREDRNRGYLRELAELIKSAADDRVELNERDIVIAASVAKNLGTVR